jgi:predicted RNA-binding Zn-ribbon protein involved in translation (DUF1610 family)/GNAT superfamily N-acetyltransferase
MVNVLSSDKLFSPYVLYDRLEITPSTKVQVPVKCPKCSNIKMIKLCSHLQTIRKNNGEYACHKCSIDSDVCSKNARKLWNDESKAEMIRNHLKSQKMRNITIEKNKRLFLDSEWVSKWKSNIDWELISSKSKLMWSDPEFRKKMSRSFSIARKKQWCNKEYRDKMMSHFASDKHKARMLDVRRNMAISKSSKQQDMLYRLLDDMGVSYDKEVGYGYYLFDRRIKPQNNISLDKTLLIEVNGDYWHSLPKSIRNDKSKSTYIMKYFTNHEIKYLWEHEFIAMDRVRNMLSYWLGITRNDIVQFNFEDISERIIDSRTAELFIGQYHYASRLGRSGINLGYFIGDKLIAVIIYSLAVRQEVAERLGMRYKDIRELSRLAIHPSYQVKNLASHLISRSIKYIKYNHNDIKLLVSFADSTYNHIGTVYKASNWVLDGIVEPSYWYIDNDGFVCHKKTLWNKANEMKMTESEYADKFGYNKVWGGEKSRYIYML